MAQTHGGPGGCAAGLDDAGPGGREPAPARGTGQRDGAARPPKKSVRHPLGSTVERYAAMKALETEHGVSELCRAFLVSRSGYYGWLRTQSKPPKRAPFDDEIREVYQEHQGRYGSPRVTRVLRQKDIPCSENRVARRMQALGLAARKRKAWVPRTTDSRHGGPICAHLLLDREQPSQPHQVWLSDITYVATGEGWLYLAGFLDVATRRLVGWAVGETLEASLVCEGLREAKMRHRPQAGLIIHSDRGSQYASGDYRQLLEEIH